MINCSAPEIFFFKIAAAQLTIQNLVLQNCIGSLFFVSSGTLDIETIRIQNQICSNQICLLNEMLASFIRIQNLILSDIYLEKKELISIANSNFSMINSSLNNIFGSRKLYLMNVINSRIITNFITAENLSQTFLYSTKSTVLVERMNFIGNKNHTISAIYSDNNKMLTVNDSVFLKFCSSRGGAILNVNTVFNLSWTLFAEKEADDGGGIFTSNSIVYFNQNQFVYIE